MRKKKAFTFEKAFIRPFTMIRNYTLLNNSSLEEIVRSEYSLEEAE